MTPHAFLRDLKQDMQQKLLILREHKNSYAKNQEYELASL